MAMTTNGLGAASQSHQALIPTQMLTSTTEMPFNKYTVRTVGTVSLTTVEGASPPDSFALIRDEYIAVQFKNKKYIQIYKTGEVGKLHMQIDQAISRNGKSFCIFDKYMAIRNLKNKCFEIIDVVDQLSMI